MHPTLHILLVVALGVCLDMPLRVCAASGIAGPPPSAVSRQPPDTSTTHRGGDQHGSTVLVRVRALVPEKITLSDPAQGTVRATVLAIDAQINQVKVQTDAGQRLVLSLTPETLARMQVGDPCLLQVAQRSTREPARPPEREEAFWLCQERREWPTDRPASAPPRRSASPGCRRGSCPVPLHRQFFAFR